MKNLFEKRKKKVKIQYENTVLAGRRKYGVWIKMWGFE
jgi:hypothetical protein